MAFPSDRQIKVRIRLDGKTSLGGVVTTFASEIMNGGRPFWEARYIVNVLLRFPPSAALLIVDDGDFDEIWDIHDGLVKLGVYFDVVSV